MNTPRSMYTVQQLADVAGVSVRTLHHYDEIGLLNPAARSEAGYRLYGREEMERLQQILFYRELDVPLAEIRDVLMDEGFDRLAALESHRRALRARARRLDVLIDTVEKTIETIRGERDMLRDTDLYAGFSRDEMERYQSEAGERWPQEYEQVDARVRKMSKEQWESIQREGEEINRALAALLASGDTEKARTEANPTSAEVQDLIARHHAWIENFYPADAARYTGLAQMYVTDERFSAYYEKYAAGLAEFLSAGMKHFAKTRLA